jgi:hypothetical protein
MSDVKAIAYDDERVKCMERVKQRYRDKIKPASLQLEQPSSSALSFPSTSDQYSHPTE